jgi:hypothetical protein
MNGLRSWMMSSGYSTKMSLRSLRKMNSGLRKMTSSDYCLSY